MADAEQTSTKRRGRPPKYAGEGKRQNFSFRIRDQVRDRLINAVKETGRSLSEEIEWRIERSFEWQDAFGEARSIIDRAKDTTAAGLDAQHYQAGHVKIFTSAGRVWAENPQALDALVLPSQLALVKRAVTEALQEAGLAKIVAEH
jgi:hypothetical protein